MGRPVLDPSRAGWAAFEHRDRRAYIRVALSPYRGFAIDTAL
jgi:hypothetical protein